MEKFVRIYDVAENLSVSRQTIYRWVRDGKFPVPVKIGGNTVAFREEDIREWQAQRERVAYKPFPKDAA